MEQRLCDVYLNYLLNNVPVFILKQYKIIDFKQYQIWIRWKLIIGLFLLQIVDPMYNVNVDLNLHFSCAIKRRCCAWKQKFGRKYQANNNLNRYNVYPFKIPLYYLTLFRTDSYWSLLKMHILILISKQCTPYNRN